MLASFIQEVIMKSAKKFLVAAITSFCVASAASAQGMYFGADVGTVRYPDYSSDLAAVYGGPASQETHGLSVGIHVGQWITDSLGWEVGYNDFGNVNGNYYAVGGSYQYSASAMHVAVMGGAPIGAGKLFGKLGLYFADTTLDDYCGLCSYIPSQTVSSSGFLLGVGYEFWVTPAFSVRAVLNLYDGVSFVDVASYGIDNRNMVQPTIGMNYSF
jgi:OmpA-like transmembrane domain